MPLVQWDGWILLLAITIGCLVFQLSGSLIALAIPDAWYTKDHRMFRMRRYEKEGTFYEKAFKISRWKPYLPDGGTYKKKHLKDFRLSSLEKFIIESKRAELSHILGLIPFVFFILFTPAYVWPILGVYALLVNVPCWMAQRYNRPRVERLQNALKKKLSEASHR